MTENRVLVWRVIRNGRYGFEIFTAKILLKKIECQ